MMAKVRVNFIIVAISKVLEEWMASQAAAVAVTEEVSLTAVPAKVAKPWLDRPNSCPRLGKVRAARILKRKITEMALATSASSASMTGAVAAIADPPQIEDPTPTKMAVCRSIRKYL